MASLSKPDLTRKYIKPLYVYGLKEIPASLITGKATDAFRSPPSTPTPLKMMSNVPTLVLTICLCIRSNTWAMSATRPWARISSSM
uniref:Uncharacterized protein n=1 Tax=Arundo donax TaxID=35708 RepID=A0A0A9C0V4_ARUDO